MSGDCGRPDREPNGVLGQRAAIGETKHPRVREPTAKSVLARHGRPLAAVGADSSVLDALEVMAERRADAVGVVSPAGLVGIFSERDLARNCVLRNKSPKNTPVAEVMTKFLAGVAPADTVWRCLALMNDLSATHVAVVDQGRLAGLLSQEDLLAARIAYYEQIFHEMEVDRKLLFLRGTYSC